VTARGQLQRHLPALRQIEQSEQVNGFGNSWSGWPTKLTQSRLSKAHWDEGAHNVLFYFVRGCSSY
jgi:hypothetical protein